MRLLAIALLYTVSSWSFFVSAAMPGPMFYRDLTLKIRQQGTFRVYLPDGRNQDVKYALKFGAPVYKEPLVSDIQWGNRKNSVLRSYYDRILLQDDSYLEIGGEKLPLTCVFVSGQDNRFAFEPSPLFPQYILRVTLVANDFACQGPIRPGWPMVGGKKEAWDTTLQYVVRDPTIMLPTEAMIRYRWNEANAVLIDKGDQP